MKKITIYCFSLLTLFSCSKKSYESIDKKNWKISFKNQVFMYSLKYLYGKDFNKILIDQDMSASNNFENLHGSYYNILADSVGKRFANTIDNLPEGYLIEGKRTILNSCLEYYNGKRLDTIADSLYSSFETHKKRK